MIFVASFSLPTAIALYWIVTNAFIIGQNYLFEITENKKNDKKPVSKDKKEKKITLKEKVEKRRGN